MPVIRAPWSLNNLVAGLALSLCTACPAENGEDDGAASTSTGSQGDSSGGASGGPTGSETSGAQTGSTGGSSDGSSTAAGSSGGSESGSSTGASGSELPPACGAELPWDTAQMVEDADIGDRNDPLQLVFNDFDNELSAFTIDHALEVDDEDCVTLTLPGPAQVGPTLGPQDDTFPNGCSGDPMVSVYRVDNLSSAIWSDTEWGGNPCPGHAVDLPAGSYVVCAHNELPGGAAPALRMHVQVRPQVCGDGWQAPGEDCDDGNTMAGDGCSASCSEEPGWSCGITFVDCPDLPVTDPCVPG